ncbi:MAG: hypothetical protein VR72_06825 [Clostridiaceae bacterium BRH_c20a]|nr:MAG: hypothetical protein VR72_06825 [Clostridiaceae bacterium BRH_c20a]
MIEINSKTNKQLKVQQWLGFILVALLIGGWFYPPLSYFMVFCMVMAMGYGVIKGRYWCDWMCPRGSFFDSFLSRFSRQKEVPKLFRHPGFRLGWLIFLMSMVALQLPKVWGDYYYMGKPFVTILTVTTIIGLLLGVIYHQRIWCMFCPMGTMANVLGRGKQPLLVSEVCNNCGRCNAVCRMQIKPGSYRDIGVVNDGDCLKCSYCIAECPRSALSFKDDNYKKAS